MCVEGGGVPSSKRIVFVPVGCDSPDSCDMRCHKWHIYALQPADSDSGDPHQR